MKKIVLIVVMLLLLLSGCNYIESTNYMTPSDKFYISVYEGNILGIEEAIEEGASVEAFDRRYGRTSKDRFLQSILEYHPLLEKNPLSYAASKGNENIIECLLKNGADPNSGSSELATNLPVILYAVFNDDYDTTRLLLEYGADVNLTYLGEDLADQLFIDGGRCGTVSEVIKILNLLNEYQFAFDAENIDRAVNYASSYKGDILSTLRQLFQLTPKEFYEKQDSLLVALLTEDTETTKSLLEDQYMSENPQLLARVAAAFGDVDDVKQMTIIGYEFNSDALVAAALYENEEVFSYLVDQGVSLSSENTTYLEDIAQNGNADILERILDISALYEGVVYSDDVIDPECIRYMMYVDEIIVACIDSGNLESVQVALSHFDGYQFLGSNLYRALKNGNYHIADYIIDHSDISVDLSIADLCGTSYDIAEYVLSHSLQAEDAAFNTDVGISAAEHGNISVLELFSYEEMDSASKESIAISAVEHGQLDALKYMYENGLSSDLLLQKACQHPCYSVFLEVLNNTTNLNKVDDEYGRTALHWAIQCGYKEYAEALVDKGADINIEDLEGVTGKALLDSAGWDIKTK